MTTVRPSASRLFKAFFIGLSIILVADVSVRVVTFVSWERDVNRFPRVAQALEQANGFLRRLTIHDVLGNPQDFPAPVARGEGPERHLTYVPVGEIEEDLLPAHPSPTPGTVRIAFFGGSTTLDGYPEEVGKLFDAAFGPGKVQVLNAGVNAVGSTTGLVLMNKFIPRWHPHLIVYYGAMNDLMYERSWVVAARESVVNGKPGDAPVFQIPAPSRGLLSVFRDGWDPPPLPPLDLWMKGAVMEKPRSNYFEMSRLAWTNGAELFVSTFASPDPSKLSADDNAYLDADIHFLWPALQSREKYVSRLEVYNARTREFAALTHTRLIDAALISGGLETFTDNCHFTEAGIHSHATIAFDALRDQVADLLARGAPPPASRTVARSPALTASSVPLETGRHTCVQGACPDGTCFVPAGRGTLGAPVSAKESGVARMRSAVGWGDPSWFDDDANPVPVSLSPFCVDRTEAAEDSVRACREAGACPTEDDSLSVSDAPAILPTAVDAEAYCAWKHGRLPTDAEWEWAARGPAASIYPWGDELTGKEANYCGPECHFGVRTGPPDGFSGAAPVNAFHSASPFGAEGMAGNMWEWVADCFFDGSHEASTGVSDPLMVTPATCARYLRGGSYASFGGLLERRLAEGTPEMAVNTRGVRCVYDFGTSFTVLRPPGPHNPMSAQTGLVPPMGSGPSTL